MGLTATIKVAGWIGLWRLRLAGLGRRISHATQVNRSADPTAELSGSNIMLSRDSGRGRLHGEAAAAIIGPLAEEGHARAQVALGDLYKSGKGVSKNDAEAFKWYRKAAELGDRDAQFQVGYMLYTGAGTAKDMRQAAAWFHKAAEQGDAIAQSNLGLMYATGRGVEEDDAQAVAWYCKAAEQGYADAQYRLGGMYFLGEGVAKDVAQAFVWYRKAAEQGHTVAQFNVGVMYASGSGVAKDDVQAVVWYRKAAEQGDAGAQNNLGTHYADGKGVKQDRSQAVLWYARSAQQGHELAPGNLERNLDHLQKLRVQSSAARVRARPEPTAPILKTLPAGETAYQISRFGDWIEVYVRDGHTLGYVSASLLAPVVTPAGSTSKGKVTAQQGPFPTAPAARPGVVTCSTKCINGDCYRTYDDGRQVRFQAKRVYNALTSQWEWDSGSC